MANYVQFSKLLFFRKFRQSHPEMIVRILVSLDRGKSIEDAQEEFEDFLDGESELLMKVSLFVEFKFWFLLVPFNIQKRLDQR